MKQLPFREYHILQLIESFEERNFPLDLCIYHYFKSNKALGSKDRAEIANTIYGMVRWKGLLDYLVEKPSSWEKKLQLFRSLEPDTYKDKKSIPSHIRLSFPKELYDLFVESHGEEKAEELCWACNFPAPTTVRVNTLKTTRDKILEKWSPDYEVSPCNSVEEGIVFHKKINFFQLPEFKEGLFEVQDEGSQQLAKMVQCQPGQLILDYCSGSGGKSLAFAPQMQGKGQIYLHDIRSHILQEARKRLKRAGIQNAQFLQPKNTLKKKMDWVLVDAPCSGTGTLRRNPDMKWKFTQEMLERLVGQQRTIFEKALSYVKPGGKIVYGTCSLLKDENQKQVEHFLSTYPLELEGSIFQSLPKRGEMDGFFGATFTRRN